MRVIAVPTWSEGNPLYPCPPDYGDLDRKGQRLARVNALRQFTLWNAVDHPIRRSEAYAAAIAFFDAYYLRRSVRPDGTIEFDPLFYRGDPIPSPDFHWMWCRARATQRKVAAVAPRGGAKSFLTAKCEMVDMLTIPRTEILYCTAAHDLTEMMGDRVKYQLYYNSRIQDDWAPAYDRPASRGLKPDRSEGRMGMTDFSLCNRSAFGASSAKSRQRGRRPNKYDLDDPEYDPSASTDMEVIRDYMENFVRAVIMPMIQGFDDAIFWSGTLISRQHYLWLAMETEEVEIDGKLVERATDPYYDDWYRIHTPAELETPEGLKSFWPHKHPIDDEEKRRLKVHPGTRTLKDVERDVGTPAFNAEYRGNPGKGVGCRFPSLSNADSEERHGYHFEDLDHLFQEKPTASSTKIVWYTETPSGREQRSMTLRDFCTRFPRIITIDGAFTESPTSDYKGCMSMTLTDENDLFALDLDLCREKNEVVANRVFKMSDVWLAQGLFPELSDDTIPLAQLLESLIKFRAQEVMGSAHLPALCPFKPGFNSKTSKIDAALAWRFEHNKIKLPLYRMKRGAGPWRMLAAQIASFNPAAPNGGLSHDDALDLLAMHIKAVPGLAARYQHEKHSTDEKSARERLLNGEKTDGNGTPLIFSALLDPKLTTGDLNAIIGPNPQGSGPPERSAI